MTPDFSTYLGPNTQCERCGVSRIETASGAGPEVIQMRVLGFCPDCYSVFCGECAPSMRCPQCDLLLLNPDRPPNRPSDPRRASEWDRLFDNLGGAHSRKGGPLSDARVEITLAEFLFGYVVPRDVVDSATKLGLKGIVRIEPGKDGIVIAEGDEEAIEILVQSIVAQCPAPTRLVRRIGISGGVFVRRTNPTGEFESFPSLYGRPFMMD